MDKQKKLELEVQRALALEAAKSYCKENGLSVDKLRNQRFIIINSTAAFGQPSDVVPDGLMNDIATQPKPTLIFRLEDGELIIEETEHTREYLLL